MVYLDSILMNTDNNMSQCEAHTVFSKDNSLRDRKKTE